MHKFTHFSYLILSISLLTLSGCGSDGSNSNKPNAPTLTINSNRTQHKHTLAVKNVRVIDGDTLEVLPKNNRPSDRVRLMGIDAPESTQENGKASKDSLQACINQGNLQIWYDKRDKYGRIVGKVMAGNTDCNLQQIQNGMAWHYKEYQNDQPLIDRNTYSIAEIQARNAKKGLWNSTCIVNPANYRRGDHTCSKYSHSPNHNTNLINNPNTGIKQCKTGKPCGNTCIAIDKTCHQ